MRMVIYLTDKETRALSRIAQLELRGMREQAQVFIRRALQSEGFLPPDRRITEPRNRPEAQDDTQQPQS